MIDRIPLLTHLLNIRKQCSDKTLLLHVGMDKTGTSAIQQFIQANRIKLERIAGVYYPQTGIWWDYSHHKIAFSVFGINGFTALDLRGMLKRLQREIAGKPTILMSSECLFKAPRAPYFEALNEFIRKNFAEVKILVYVRPQDDWVESRYKHSVLSAAEIPLYQLTTPAFCDYKIHVDRWAKMYGRSSVEVRPYENSQFPNESIFEDFLSGINVTYRDDYEIPGRRVNESLNACAHGLKRLCNFVGFTNCVDELNAILLAYSRSHKSVRDLHRILSPQERKNLLAKYKASNDLLAAEYVRERNVRRLFVKEGKDVQQDGWQSFGEVRSEELIPILEFIAEKNSKVFLELKSSVAVALENIEDLRARDAAEILSDALSLKK